MSRKPSPPPSEASLPGTPVEEEVVEIPIDGNLDLHVFQPREVKALVTEYLWACRQKGLLDVRLIHGKGTGALRKTVHSVLPKLSSMESFRTAEERDGGWGATWVRLKPLPPGGEDPEPPSGP
jgi:DNA-nicking Smr family endonuclease